MFGRADCGLGRIAALTGLDRIADCTFGNLPCKGPSCGLTNSAGTCRKAPEAARRRVRGRF
eukprot:3195787-Alexandrium_andersonii.AAC.1